LLARGWVKVVGVNVFQWGPRADEWNPLKAKKEEVEKREEKRD
jgi:hypothetical protein